MKNAPNFAADLEAAALLIDGTTTHLAVFECQRIAAALRHIRSALAHQEPVYASPAAETPNGTAYVLSEGEAAKPQGEYQTLYRSPVSQLQNDVLIAWCSGLISEGRACHALNVDRTQLRRMRLASIDRVSGPPLNPEQSLARIRNALDQLNARFEEIITSEDEPTYGEDELFALRNFWAGALADPEFLQAFEEWRYLLPQAKDPQL